MNQIKQIATLSSYAFLRKRVKEALLLGRLRIEQEKIKTYWQTGKLIHEHILEYKNRADYGRQVIKRLSEDLTVSERSLYETVQFARSFPILRARKIELVAFEKTSGDSGSCQAAGTAYQSREA